MWKILALTMPKGWNTGSTAPTDGTLFVFRVRHPATYMLTPPMIGRILEGELQVYTGSRWRAYAGEVSEWTEIPGE